MGAKLEKKAVDVPQKLPDGFTQQIRPIVFARSLMEKFILWVLRTNEEDKSA